MSVPPPLPRCRNIHLCHQRVKAGNYTLSGLIGFELSGKTFGVVGTGKIGVALIKLLKVRLGQLSRAKGMVTLVASWQWSPGTPWCNNAAHKARHCLHFFDLHP